VSRTRSKEVSESRSEVAPVKEFDFVWLKLFHRNVGVWWRFFRRNSFGSGLRIRPTKIPQTRQCISANGDRAGGKYVTLRRRCSQRVMTLSYRARLPGRSTDAGGSKRASSPAPGRSEVVRASPGFAESLSPTHICANQLLDHALAGVPPGLSRYWGAFNFCFFCAG
jgi:hypothetical protein